MRHATLFAIVLSVLLIPACVSSGGGGQTPVVIPFRQSTWFSGELKPGSVVVMGVPITYPLRAWGEGTLTTIFPGPDGKPQFIFEGDGGWTIEPITPQARPVLETAIRSGHVVLGPHRLSASGTIASMKESPK